MTHHFRIIAVLCAGLFVLFSSPTIAAIALAQTPASTTGSTSANISLSGVGANDLLVLQVYDNSATAPTITESLSETVNTAVAWGSNFNATSYMGIYYVQGTAGGAISFAVTCTGATSCVSFLSDYSGVASTGALDTATAIAAANSTSAVSTAAITPATSGELIIVGQVSPSNTGVTWSTPFVNKLGPIGNGVHANYADEIGATGAVTPSGTTSFNVQWAAAAVAFKPASGGGSCTHDGITSAGAIAIPNGTSGSYRLTSGAIGTPDCSTVSYKQTQGAVGVN